MAGFLAPAEDLVSRWLTACGAQFRAEADGFWGDAAAAWSNLADAYRLTQEMPSSTGT